jgi:hypothetical protein
MTCRDPLDVIAATTQRVQAERRSGGTRERIGGAATLDLAAEITQAAHRRVPAFIGRAHEPELKDRPGVFQSHRSSVRALAGLLASAGTS